MSEFWVLKIPRNMPAITQADVSDAGPSICPLYFAKNNDNNGSLWSQNWTQCNISYNFSITGLYPTDTRWLWILWNTRLRDNGFWSWWASSVASTFPRHHIMRQFFYGALSNMLYMHTCTKQGKVGADIGCHASVTACVLQWTWIENWISTWRGGGH
jgi:hypothetical protein